MIVDERKPQQFNSIRKIGSTGINYFDDPQDIRDTDVANALNIVFDKGYPAPRGGSSLAWPKPVGETNNLLCLFDVRASDGTNYAVAGYAPNFYLRDETNNQWVKISRSETLGVVTVTIAMPAVFTLVSHGLVPGDAVILSTTGALPTGLTAGTVYYVLSGSLGADVFEVSATPGGSAVDTSGSQSGVHTIKRNSYTPSATYKGLMYGYKNWNAGVGSDVLYFGNGKEDSIKWHIGSGYLSAAASVGDTTLTFTDTTKFPASGTIVIKELNSAPIYTTYSAKTSTTLTIPALQSGAGVGACVTSQISDATTVAKGNIFSVFDRRLVVAGKIGAESTIFGSEIDSAENFVVPGTPNGTDPFTEVITDGNGGITGIDNFGEYLVIEKEDALFKFLITVTQNSDGTATFQNITVLPVASDTSMGPVQPWTKIKKNNILYYLTKTEGAFAIDPQVTGSQMSVETSIISRPIQPYITKLNFANSRAVTFHQKILWSVASQAASDTVLVYDLMRSVIKNTRSDYTPENDNFVWSRFNNWPVQDWLPHNKKLYYGSRIDGGIYECFTDTKVDGDKPFEASFSTKRYDFGQGALPKTMSKVFVSGYISRNETLLFDMTLVTGNQIVTIPYSLAGDGTLTVLQIPQALAMMMMGIPTLGMASITPVDEVMGIFRCYLAVPSRYGFFTVQLTPHSLVNGTDWGFTGIGFAPWIELKAPELLAIGSIGDITTRTAAPPTVQDLQLYQMTENTSVYTDEIDNI